METIVETSFRIKTNFRAAIKIPSSFISYQLSSLL